MLSIIIIIKNKTDFTSNQPNIIMYRLLSKLTYYFVHIINLRSIFSGTCQGSKEIMAKGQYLKVSMAHIIG